MLALVGLVTLAGCERPAPQVSRIPSYLSSYRDIERIRRVVFVELGDGQQYPELAEQMTNSLAKALSDAGLFHISVLDRDDALCKDLKLDRPRPYTTEDLAAMRDALDCDAVLLGEIKNFKPYPRMQMGLYLGLVDLRQGRMVWGVDHFWDTTDRALEPRLKRFYQYHMRSGYQPAEWELGLMSPRAFQKFLADEAARTLCPPPPPKPDQPLTARPRRLAPYGQDRR